MPLIKSKSDKAFKKNVATEVKAGKPVKQAVAIAYNTKRIAKKASGGMLSSDAHLYDSDIDYYDSLSRGNDHEEPEEQKPNRVVKADKRRRDSIVEKNTKLRRMHEVAAQAGDQELSKKLQDRRWRMNYNDMLWKQAKDTPYGHRVRKDAQKKWSEAIGKGKPAPFKSGGKAKSGW